MRRSRSVRRDGVLEAVQAGLGTARAVAARTGLPVKLASGYLSVLCAAGEIVVTDYLLVDDSHRTLYVYAVAPVNAAHQAVSGLRVRRTYEPVPVAPPRTGDERTVVPAVCVADGIEYEVVWPLTYEAPA